MRGGHEIVAKVGHADDVVDIRMPPEMADDGARAARWLRDAHPALPIVLLSQHVETRYSNLAPVPSATSPP